MHQRHVAQPGEREVQRTRNRRRGERQHVGLELELLESLLVLHAESMLFVDDDETEPFEGDVGTQEPVSADYDVDRAVGELGENRRLLLRCLKAAEHGDAHRKIGEPFTEGARMLIGEDRRRYENGDLPLGLHRFESRAHGDLRLPVADVPDEQAIHRPDGFHIGLHLGGRFSLIGRVLEQEGRLELTLPRGVRNVRRARRHLAACVQIEELDGHLVNCRARFLTLLAPPFPAELMQSRGW